MVLLGMEGVEGKRKRHLKYFFNRGHRRREADISYPLRGECQFKGKNLAVFLGFFVGEGSDQDS